MSGPSEYGTPGRYGTKKACAGSWHYPLTGSAYIAKGSHGSMSREAFINLMKRVPISTDYRAPCPVCKKDCALKADGTIHPHVNTPLTRKLKREQVKAAITHAKTDLLALHNELRTEEP